ncbi:TetR/AcrR family transcriptional regulator [Ilumatobacter sp.]|uniref:TetR/AcrR family transcriptional regulator n=1 Tax=Ilumatobacter sp. TaxID=1967498 RepID=UPI003B5172B4
MGSQAMAGRAATEAPRIGRPAKGANAVATRERLLVASVDEFVERGFDRAGLTRIAERAGVSGPAVYKHFDGKADLLVHAARRSLDQMLRTIETTRSPHELARRWLADDFTSTRRLLVELHVAASREGHLANLLDEWILEQTTLWTSSSDDSVEQVKVFYLLLLGLAQIDSLSSLLSTPDVVGVLVDRMVDALFADGRTTN